MLPLRCAARGGGRYAVYWTPSPPQRRWCSDAAAALRRKFTTDRDACVKVLSEGGVLRCSALQMPNAAAEALSRHNLPAESPAAADLARTMMLAVLFASFQGGEERVKVDIETREAHYSAEASAAGEVRGRVAEPSGTPTVKVSKILYNQRTPIVSVTPSFTGEVVSDAKEHIWRSDGVDTALWMEVDLAKHVCVGGICQRIPDSAEALGEKSALLQGVEEAMAAPGGAEEDVARAAHVLTRVFSGDLTSLCAKTKLVDRGFAGAVVGTGPHAVSATAPALRIPVDFHCRCSLDDFARGLRMMGQSELATLKFEQPACPLTCQNCGKVYTMTPEAWGVAFEPAAEA